MESVVAIPLTWRTLPLSMNVRLHHMVEYRAREAIKNEMLVKARQLRIPKGLEWVHIELHWRPAKRNRRDTDNPAPSLKAVIDGLVKYGLVADDNSEHVSSETVIEPVGDRVLFWVSIKYIALDPGQSVDGGHSRV